MNTPMILFDRDTFPPEVTEKFTGKSYLEIWTNYTLPLLCIWDLELYFFLKIHEYPQIKYRYYPNGFSFSRAELPIDLIAGNLFDFFKGYKEGYDPNYYLNLLNQKLYDIEPTNEERKKKILKLEEEYRTYKLKFYGYGLSDKDFNELGKSHGLYSRLIERIQEHGWSIQRNETQKPLGEFEKILHDPANFSTIEDILEKDGYFGTNMDVMQLAAWGLFLNDHEITKATITRKGGTKKGVFNFARLNESLFDRYIKGKSHEKNITLKSLKSILADGITRRKKVQPHLLKLKEILKLKGVHLLKDKRTSSEL